MRRVTIEALCLDTLRDVVITMVIADDAPQVIVDGSLQNVVAQDADGIPHPLMGRVRAVEYVAGDQP